MIRKGFVAVLVVLIIAVLGVTSDDELEPTGCHGNVQVSTELRGLRLFNSVGEKVRVFTSPIPAGMVRDVVQRAWELVGRWGEAFNDAVNGRPRSPYYEGLEAEQASRQQAHDDGCNPCVDASGDGSGGSDGTGGGSPLASLSTGRWQATKVAGYDLTATQVSRAAAAVQTVREVGGQQGWTASEVERASLAVIVGAYQESQLGDDPLSSRRDRHGDGGFLGQRSKPGWYGTLEQTLDPAYATRAFLLGHEITYAGPESAGGRGYRIPGLVDVKGWPSLPLTVAVQRVQRSAFPNAYAKHEAMARALLEKLTSRAAAAAPAGDGKRLDAPVNATIGARFGATGSWARYHTGVDYRAGQGTPVRVVEGGVVTYAGNSGNWAGNHVAVKHPDGYSTMYSHLSRILVSDGQDVTAGTVIGQVGNTGRSFGAHLHFEVYPPGVKPGDVYKAVDPQKWLNGGYGGPGALPAVEVPAPPAQPDPGVAGGAVPNEPNSPEAGAPGVDCGVDAAVGSWSAGALRLGTWNVFGRGRNDEIAKGVRAMAAGADAFGLQEMSSEADRAAARRALPEWRMTTDRTAVPIMWNPAKLDLLREERVKALGVIRVEGEGGTVGPKFIVSAHLRERSSGQTLWLVNTHFLWDIESKGRPQKGQPRRTEAARTHIANLAAIVKAKRSGSEPVVVTCDCNVDESRTKAAGDPFLAPLRAAGLVSNHSALGEVNTHGSRAIDYGWVAGAKIVSQRTVAGVGSDHRGLIITIGATRSNPVASDGVSKGKVPARSFPTSGLTRDAVHLERCVAVRFPAIKDYSIGGGGDHAKGLAVDFMVPGGPRWHRGGPEAVALGWSVANWAKDNAQQLGVQYIVWDKKIWNIQRDTEGWRDYAVKGQPPHYDHVHVTTYGDRGNNKGETCNV